MVAARTEPYTAGWNKALADPRAKLTYVPHPYASVQRIPDTISYQALNGDAIAAHLHAIQWTVTKNAAHARKAVEILNAWSTTLTTFPSTGDPVLTAGLTGYQLAAAAEIMRATYPEWAAADQERLRALLLTKFYPIFHNFLIYHAADGLPRTDTGVNVHFHTNWDAIAMASMAALAVFADDRPKYQEALRNFTDGTGNGNIMRAVFDGATGQLEESGRDPEHAQLGIGQLAVLCEIAWNQGDDLYGYADSRLLKGFEYTASYLLGNEVPFRTYTDPFRTFTVISSESTAAGIAASRSNPRPIYEMVWNHYVNRRRLAAPFTKQIAEKIRPEGYRADHIGFGTLLFTRPTGASGAGGGGGAGGAGRGGAGGGATATGGAGGRATATGGAVGSGGGVSTGGTVATGGAAGGALPPPTGDAVGAAGATSTGGGGGTAGASVIDAGEPPIDASNGCGCRISGRPMSDAARGSSALAILLALGGTMTFRPRRRRGSDKPGRRRR